MFGKERESGEWGEGELSTMEEIDWWEGGWRIRKLKACRMTYTFKAKEILSGDSFGSNALCSQAYSCRVFIF